jgi:hypothetical protein
MSQLYIYLAVIVLLMTVGAIVLRPSSKAVDWALIAAFIRLEFPPHQRDLAQKIAAGLAEVVGFKIKQLRPEHTLAEIAKWADDPIAAMDLIKIFHAAFKVTCDDKTTFRAVVEMIAEEQAKK